MIYDFNLYNLYNLFIIYIIYEKIIYDNLLQLIFVSITKLDN